MDLALLLTICHIWEKLVWFLLKLRFLFDYFLVAFKISTCMISSYDCMHIYSRRTTWWVGSTKLDIFYFLQSNRFIWNKNESSTIRKIKWIDWIQSINEFLLFSWIDWMIFSLDEFDGREKILSPILYREKNVINLH